VILTRVCGLFPVPALTSPFGKLILTHNLGCWTQGGKKRDGR